MGNYYFECKIRLIQGDFISMSEYHQMQILYCFHPGGVSLNKDYATGQYYNLASKEDIFTTGIWYTVKIFCLNDMIKIYVNDELKIEYTDDDPS